MKQILKCFFVIVIFNFLGCKNEEKKEEIKTVVKADTIGNDFQNKLKNEKKIFLKYWSGMSVEDFMNVSEILHKEGILYKSDYINYEYITGECSVKINAVYKNNKLREIVLYDNEMCLYPYYVKKYKLPKIVYKNTLYSNYYGDNSEYSPLLTYTKNKETFRVPSILIENVNYEEIPVEKSKETNNEKVYPFENYMLDKDNVVIIFKQKFIETDHPHKTYSLSLNTEAMKTMYSINGSYSESLYDDGITGIHIARNSKKVNIKKFYFVEKRIIFLDKKFYLDSLNRNNIRKNLIKKSKDSLINRSKNISNEI